MFRFQSYCSSKMNRKYRWRCFKWIFLLPIFYCFYDYLFIYSLKKLHEIALNFDNFILIYSTIKQQINIELKSLALHKFSFDTSNKLQFFTVFAKLNCNLKCKWNFLQLLLNLTIYNPQKKNLLILSSHFNFSQYFRCFSSKSRLPTFSNTIKW